MADNNKKMVEEITSMEVDFGRWYTDVVKKADLVDYSSVKGCMIIRPYGYAIWELIQKQLDERFKATGHENVYTKLKFDYLSSFGYDIPKRRGSDGRSGIYG